MKHNVPTIFVIFGATGDLAQRKLIPALLDLYARGYLPERYYITGFSRRQFSQDGFREFMFAAIENKKHSHSKEIIDEFLNNVSYVAGDFGELTVYEEIARELSRIDDAFGMCSNKLFYLAVPPNYYEGIFNNLSKSDLTIPCGGEGNGWTRVLVEKPFGRDIDTAAKLDQMLGQLFKEEQIFRIDHYLAKETLQNILTFRFSNALFEPLWNSKYIEKVEIQLFETLGIEGRGSFYDPIGALRDMGQSHMLQMLAFIAMDDPAMLDANVIREKRSEVLHKLETIDVSDCIRGQFKGYLEEKGVAAGSETETYFKVRALINSSRWKGVPFILENGKQMNETKTEIKVYFNSSASCLCPPGEDHNHQNILTFRIQPDEGISVLFWAKKPGFEFGLESKELSFKYKDSPDTKALPLPYERVLYDCIRGDQTLFASTKEITASWNFITPILEGWRTGDLLMYDKGTRGPNI